MNVQNESKINRLGQALPEGLLVNAAWLEQRGYYSSLRSQYVASGWLEQPARGVFRRPRGSVSWEQVVISMQAMLGFRVSVGGRTALELQGYAHYLPHHQKIIHLYSDDKLPGWVSKLNIDPALVLHNRLRFLPKAEYESLTLSDAEVDTLASKNLLEGAFRVTLWGQWNWPLVLSTPERAILELLDELPKKETFHVADTIIEGLVDLSPRRMQSLLEQTTSVKIKRLFFFFADRYQHQWLKRIDRNAIDLGSGKRMLVKGGKFDPDYQITVPEDLDGVQ